MSARVSRMRREDLPGANRFHRHQTTKTSPPHWHRRYSLTPSIRPSEL